MVVAEDEEECVEEDDTMKLDTTKGRSGVTRHI